MMIWVAYNGYHGNGSVAALVDAETEESARAQAIEAFAKDGCIPDAQRVTKIESISFPVVVEIDF